ncbi:MAG: hypothetical protein EZS28_054571, partial [Streblomastix strix]
MPIDESTTERSFVQPVDEQATARNHKKYKINKYKEVERTTAQVEPEEAIQKLAEEQPRNIYLSHPNLEVMKFIIDKILATVTTRKRGDDFIFSSDNFIKLWVLITQNSEDDIEIVLEEPLMRARFGRTDTIENGKYIYKIITLRRNKIGREIQAKNK